MNENSAKSIALGLVFLVASGAVQVRAVAGQVADKALFESTCSACHAAKASWHGTRDVEQWKKVVGRMQGHAKGGGNAFGDATATRIAAYLGEPPSAPVPPETETDSADAPVSTGHHGPVAADVPGDSSVSSHVDLHSIGAVLGGGAGFCLVALVGSGLIRRRLKRRFHTVHVGLATAFGLSLVGHAVLLLLGTGGPRSLWHACGVAALVVGSAAAGAGLGRRRIGRRFPAIHKTLALLALVLVILHRVLE